MPLRSFCRYLRAEISHGEPDRARDNFQKKVWLWLQKNTILFLINRSFIRPPSLEPRRNMTAHGLSSYELFAKKLCTPSAKVEISFSLWHLFEVMLQILWKSHFLILSTFRTLLKGLCFLKGSWMLAMLLFFGQRHYFVPYLGTPFFRIWRLLIVCI